MKLDKFFFTVDVEDWFHTANFSKSLTIADWDKQEKKVEANTETILEILADTDNKGTFFILGWIAERHPQLIKKIAAGGHEIASHGYNHQLIYSLTHDEFKKDVSSAKKLLEDLTGQHVIGYRAPNFSITDWAIDILKEEGYLYDSSVFPTAFHDRYGKLERYPIRTDSIYDLTEGFKEIPLSCNRLANKNVPWAGGAYFRLLPFMIYKFGFSRILKKNKSFNFYIHPWELDPNVEIGHLLSGLLKFRQELNLQYTTRKIKQLLLEFKSTSIASYLNNNLCNPANF